jgi:hypothetical protein
VLTVLEQHFLARSDWVELLRESHSCYIKHANKLLSSTTIRSQSKKLALLELWRDMGVSNPLKIVMRNLTQVALVLALYMLVSAHSVPALVFCLCFTYISQG